MENPYSRSSQAETTKEHLNNLLFNPYNKYCVDCQKNESTHASVTFGIFICATCAKIHDADLGKQKSYTKTLFQEEWDIFQLHIMTLGGNQPFYEFLQEYQIQDYVAKTKYTNYAVAFYKRKLWAQAQEIPFDEKPPAKNWEETWERSKEKAGTFAKSAEAGILKAGSAIDGFMERQGWKQKIGNMFNKSDQ